MKPAMESFVLGIRAGVLLSLLLWGLVMVLGAGCDFDWKGDEILPLPPRVVSQGMLLVNETDDPVVWRFGEQSWPTPARAQLAVFLECSDGARLCPETTPMHAFACISCGRGTVILRAQP
jgi:hypothetical protein